MLLRIGEFAQLSQTSTKMLRYYDEIGLLKPASTDPETSYRYYTTDQLKQLHRILLFKTMGFALEQIMLLIQENISDYQLQHLLKQRKIELLASIQQQEAQLRRVENSLQQLQLEHSQSSLPVTLKHIAPCHVIAIRETLSYSENVLTVAGRLYAELERSMQASAIQASGPSIHLFPAHHEAQDTYTLEIAYPLCGTVHIEQGKICIYELPGVETMASLFHEGDPHVLMHSHYLLANWISEHGYRIIGPKREIYHTTASSYHTMPGISLTEIHYPVEKSF